MRGLVAEEDCVKCWEPCDTAGLIVLWQFWLPTNLIIWKICMYEFPSELVKLYTDTLQCTLVDTNNLKRLGCLGWTSAHYAWGGHQPFFLFKLGFCGTSVGALHLGRQDKVLERNCKSLSLAIGNDIRYNVVVPKVSLFKVSKRSVTLDQQGSDILFRKRRFKNSC